MKFISGLIGLIIMLLALCFALANRQSATISLWPFEVELQAPLYLLTLGTLFAGIVLGAVIAWFLALSHRLEARRLRKDIAVLNQKILDVQQSVLPPTHDASSYEQLQPKRRFLGFRL